MKVPSMFSAVCLGVASSLSAQSLPEIPTILEARELPDGGGAVQRFLWRTDPGVRYLLKSSSDLETWTDVAGYPITADAPVEFHDSTLTTTAQVFYQAFRLDEQAPTIVSRYPDDGSYAIPRFADFSINVEDATGIDPASISLTIGSQDAHTVANQPNLTLTENVISFDVVDIAHGAVGETVDVVLTVADTLGHSASYEWSFILEVEPQQLVTDLTVFGSAEAQRAGQRLSASQRSVANSLIGPVRLPAGDGDTFTLTSITPTQVLITYTGDNPPAYAAGRHISNLCPTTPEEIIYREITGVVHDAAEKTLTLDTVDVELATLVDGTSGISDESKVFAVDQSGELQPALSLSKTIIFPTMEVDNFLAAEPLEFRTAGGSTIATLGDSNSEFGFTFTPSLTASLETKFGSLQSLDIDLGGMMDLAAVYNVTVQTPEVALEKELYNLPEASEPHKILYLGQIGLVPVFADLRVDLTVNASLNASASLSAEFGVRRRFEQHFVLSYEKGNDLIFKRRFTPHETEPIPFDVDLAGNLNAEIRVKPSVEFLLYGVAGISAGVVAKAGVDFEKAGDEPLTAIYDLGLDLQIQPVGLAFSFLSDEAKEGKTWELWSQEWDLLSQLAQLRNNATAQDEDETLSLERVTLGQTGVNGTWTPYVNNTRFLYGDNPVPGVSGPVLTVPLMTYAEPFASEGVASSSDGVVTEVASPPVVIPPSGDGGFAPDSLAGLRIKVFDANQAEDFRIFTFGAQTFTMYDGYDDVTYPGVEYEFVQLDGEIIEIIFLSPEAPDPDDPEEEEAESLFLEYTNVSSGLVLEGSEEEGFEKDGLFEHLDEADSAPIGFATIPAGSFVMGDTFGEGRSDEVPVRTVFVSEFAMGKTEVTKKQWDEVRTWGLANGYTDLRAGGGKGETHPVHTVNWYDIVKWCNAKSEMEGLLAVYTVGGSVYRSGNRAPEINYAVKSYRLPTEAEWEKAARGGLAGKRFPWGDIINHSRANYFGRIGSYSYEDGSTTGRHPDYDDDGDPATSPVGSFGANGYGLFDMSGNVWEWCGDWYGTYAGTSDPTGPSSGSYRVIRGGGWSGYAWLTRCALRNGSGPAYTDYNFGFRLALGQ